MTVIDIDALLAPVSAEAPCGSDLEYERPFLALEVMVRGKPEQLIGDIIRPAEEPEWPEVQASAEALLASTKDVRIASRLHMALLKTRGIAGFEAGLHLQRRLLDQYWEQLHPQLEPEARYPAEFRVNAMLSLDEGIMAALRVAPLVESRQFGKHSLHDYRMATAAPKAHKPDGELRDPQQQLALIEAAFADAKIEDLSQNAALVGLALEHVKAIKQILLDKTDDIPHDLYELTTDLREMKKLLDTQLAKRAPATTDPKQA